MSLYLSAVLICSALSDAKTKISNSSRCAKPVAPHSGVCLHAVVAAAAGVVVVVPLTVTATARGTGAPRVRLLVTLRVQSRAECAKRHKHRACGWATLATGSLVAQIQALGMMMVSRSQFRAILLPSHFVSPFPAGNLGDF